MASEPNPSRKADRGVRPTSELDLAQVCGAVQGIRFGEVRVIIQDGVIVQIERVEKQRLR